MKTCGQFKDDVGQIGSVLSDMCRVTWRLRSSAPKFSFDMTSDVNTVKLSGKDWLGHHVLFREVAFIMPLSLIKITSLKQSKKPPHSLATGKSTTNLIIYNAV